MISDANVQLHSAFAMTLIPVVEFCSLQCICCLHVNDNDEKIIMTAGLDSPQDTCWYAREVVTLDDLISDIDIYVYYIVTHNIILQSYLILQVL